MIVQLYLKIRKIKKIRKLYVSESHLGKRESFLLELQISVGILGEVFYVSLDCFLIDEGKGSKLGRRNRFHTVLEKRIIIISGKS